MASESESSPERHDLSPHIRSAPVVMIGVSTTLIGLVKVAKGHMGPSRVDEYAGLAALLFLISACGSYPFAMCCLPTRSSNGPIMTTITASMDRFEPSVPPREARGSEIWTFLVKRLPIFAEYAWRGTEPLSYYPRSKPA